MKRIFSKEKMWEVEKNDKTDLSTIDEMEKKYPWVNTLDGCEVKFDKNSNIGLIKIKNFPVPYIVSKVWTVEVDDDFDKEPKKVFSIYKWYDSIGKKFGEEFGINNKKDLLEICSWCYLCEGREPINGMIDSFKIADDWCVYINEYKRFEI